MHWPSLLVRSGKRQFADGCEAKRLRAFRLQLSGTVLARKVDSFAQNQATALFFYDFAVQNGVESLLVGSE
jgi:hypothetical protein